MSKENARKPGSVASRLSKLLPGHWYWVTDGKSTWPAMHDPNAANGWTNRDTWEDFGAAVLRSELIANPVWVNDDVSPA